MATDPEDALIYSVNGEAMRILNAVGHGLREKAYERGLVVGLRKSGVQLQPQNIYPVIYLGETIDEYIPDLEVERQLIVECKVVESIIDDHIGQVLNYLKITGKRVGLILNFKKPKLEWRKVVLAE